jgi:hypothetical protein
MRLSPWGLLALVRSQEVSQSWCDGDQTEYESCSQNLCEADAAEQPVDAEFGEWNEWGECGCEFLKERSRPVKIHHKNGGKPLSGPILQAEKCTPEDLSACSYAAPQDCKVGSWSEWSDECKCGVLQVFRHRDIEIPVQNCGEPCAEVPLNQTKSCDQTACTEKVDCMLTAWSVWDKCSVTCGGGQHTRTRYVEKYPQNGGEPCEGTLQQTEGCNTHCCDDKLPVDCEWGKWSPWSACNAECDGGEKTRMRMLQTPPRNGGKWCDPGNVREVASCNENPCNPNSPVNGKWHEWGEWGECTVTCDGGFQWRSRVVETAAANGGKPASGPFQDFRPCKTEVCMADGHEDCEFTPWQEWSGCSSECNGYKQRSREIKTHAKNGGNVCDGAMRTVEACNVDSKFCKTKQPHNCEFGEWEDWGTCSASCDGGTQQRVRAVAADATFSGEGCEGQLKELKACHMEYCNVHAESDIDCVWDEWSNWGGCSKTCGGGTHDRIRSVMTPAKNDGKVCTTESSFEVAPCHTEPCGENHFCTWADWKAWGECSATCSGGERSRTRSMHIVSEDDDRGVLATQRFFLAVAAVTPGGLPGVCALSAIGGALLGVLVVLRTPKPRAPPVAAEMAEEPLME